jgi:hypothetical protein
LYIRLFVALAWKSNAQKTRIEIIALELWPFTKRLEMIKKICYCLFDFSYKEMPMHTDENKRFDKRNIESSLRRGVMASKEYENYLNRLPDASDKIFDPEDESPGQQEDVELRGSHEDMTKKRGGKGKGKG